MSEEARHKLLFILSFNQIILGFVLLHNKLLENLFWAARECEGFLKLYSEKQ